MGVDLLLVQFVYYELMANYRKLDIWEQGCRFAGEIYEATRGWKDFGLKDQITRSVVSIASNIAEGSERESDADFIRFLRIAKASCAECRTQLTIAQMTGQLEKRKFEQLDAEGDTISRKIGALIKYLAKCKAH